jgi:EmrB/QacA subfamily drug resistance transporter
MRAPSYKIAVTVVYILALFMQILDATIVNVALPTLADEFGVEVTDVEWVVVGYLLALAVGIPAAGWFGDRFGSKRVFLTALMIFTVASAMCGAANSLDQLIAFRVLQGLGAGMLTPIGSAILFRAYPLEERAKAAIAVVGVAVIAPAIGPALGGIIVDTISWRWIFYVNVPIGVLALTVGWLWLREHTEPDAGRLDIAGLLLSGGSLALLLYGMSIGPERGWGSPVTLGVLVGAAAAMAALVIIELRIAEPILDLRLFRERLFRTINIAGLFAYAGFLGHIFLFTLYLQTLRGSSAMAAGFTQSPQALGVVVVSNLFGRRLYMAVGPRRLLMSGTLATGAVTMTFAATDTSTPIGVLATMMFARGLAVGMVFIAIQTAVYSQISLADTAKATSIFGAQRQTGNALGVAISATILAALATTADGTTAAAADGLRAYRVGFLVSGALFIPAAIASSFIHDEDAAATRPPVSHAAAEPR